MMRDLAVLGAQFMGWLVCSPIGSIMRGMGRTLLCHLDCVSPRVLLVVAWWGAVVGAAFGVTRLASPSSLSSSSSSRAGRGFAVRSCTAARTFEVEVHGPGCRGFYLMWTCRLPQAWVGPGSGPELDPSGLAKGDRVTGIGRRLIRRARAGRPGGKGRARWTAGLLASSGADGKMQEIWDFVRLILSLGRLSSVQTTA